MRDSTTIRVTPRTRDQLKDMAARERLTIDQMLAKLLRAERQRRLGEALRAEPSSEDLTWMQMAGAVVIDDAGR